ncbi:AMP-binding protein [Actinokineospora diospyrosa]|uniref:Amino acid adenylation domain-containing protein n=1 Tax=Actinokineospora diospyrosa TaxID=103728 RepID=A0ABT1I5W2_9PSEU|nr:AMP-binding protein [Actinokineospora diospyrosa]MCP2268020.1 amino acid adenylation domain-containing protein [Actinokineospora diospyrosa]
MRSLYEWFTDSAGRHPDRPAIVVDGVEHSYRDLARAAAGLAERISRTGAPRRIALHGMRSLTAYTGYLAALHLGAAVIPLNPRFPLARNKSVLAAAGADLVLIDPVTGEPDLGAPSLVIEPTDGGAAPVVRTGPDELAYILFTSGSTGRPKGVPISNRNLDAYISYAVERFDLRPGDRVSHSFDLTFDPSVFDLFVTWAAGAAVVVPNRVELLSPVDYLVRNEITHWFSVPSVVSVSARLGKLTGSVPSVRHSLFIGEPLTLDQARAWLAVTPNARITNVYGPTELTVACSDYRLPSHVDSWPVTGNGTVPIGAVHPGLDWLLLDEDGAPATDGELVVRGAQRFEGYLESADDAGRFVTGDGAAHTGGPLSAEHYYRTGDRVRLENGELVHLGRLDDQVKVRGYRVELGEIEGALRGRAGIGEVVVLAVPGATDLELVACHTGGPVDPDAVLRELRADLPIHMIPRRFHPLEEFPRTPNGKTDRRALRDLVRGEPWTSASSTSATTTGA